MSDARSRLETLARRELARQDGAVRDFYPAILAAGAPKMPALSDDVYSAYTKWRAASGHMSIGMNQFIPGFLAIHDLRRKDVRVPDPDTKKLARRRVILFGTPNGESQNAWIHRGVQAFKNWLQVYEPPTRPNTFADAGQTVFSSKGDESMVSISQDPKTAEIVIQTNCRTKDKYIEELGVALANALHLDETQASLLQRTIVPAVPIAFKLKGYQAEEVREQHLLTCGSVSPDHCQVLGVSDGEF